MWCMKVILDGNFHKIYTWIQYGLMIIGEKQQNIIANNLLVNDIEM